MKIKNILISISLIASILFFGLNASQALAIMDGGGGSGSSCPSREDKMWYYWGSWRFQVSYSDSCKSCGSLNGAYSCTTRNGSGRTVFKYKTTNFAKIKNHLAKQYGNLGTYNSSSKEWVRLMKTENNYYLENSRKYVTRKSYRHVKYKGGASYYKYTATDSTSPPKANWAYSSYGSYAKTVGSKSATIKYFTGSKGGDYTLNLLTLQMSNGNRLSTGKSSGEWKVSGLAPSTKYTIKFEARYKKTNSAKSGDTYKYLRTTDSFTTSPATEVTEKAVSPGKTKPGNGGSNDSSRGGSSSSCGTALLKEGSRGDYVKSLQTQLNKYGNYKLVVDGIFGPKTKSALISFQKKEKLNCQSGIYDSASKKQLESKLGNKYKPNVTITGVKSGMTVAQGIPINVKVKGTDSDKNDVKVRMFIYKEGKLVGTSNWSAVKESGYTWSFNLLDAKLLNKANWGLVAEGNYSFKVEVTDGKYSRTSSSVTFKVKKSIKQSDMLEPLYY